MIELEKVSKFYGDFQALRDITFSISKGEIIGFLGPNGAGKTTTMRIITDYFPPSSGSVRIKGLPPSQAKKFIGYMPESNPLYPDMFVEDYLRFALRLKGLKENGRIKKVVKDCGLSPVMSKKIGELSKGYRQRVGLAGSLIHDPEILILDEPTIGLDPNQVQEVRNLIKERGQEKTVIISTHILSEAEALATRVIIINRGEIAFDSPAESIDKAFSSVCVLKLKELPEDYEQISKIQGVEKIEREGDTLRIFHKKDVDIREELFKFCVQKNWVVLELFRQRVALEDVFRNLTV